MAKQNRQMDWKGQQEAKYAPTRSQSNQVKIIGSNNNFLLQSLAKNIETPATGGGCDRSWSSQVFQKSHARLDLDHDFDKEYNSLSLSSHGSSHSSKRYKSGGKRVRFGDVTVRKYTVVLGDNPSCVTPGPPLSLGWEHGEDRSISVRRFETYRSGNRCTDLRELRVATEKRWEILLKLGFQAHEIHKVCLECDQIQEERRSTLQTLLETEDPVPKFKGLLRSPASILRRTKRLANATANATGITAIAKTVYWSGSMVGKQLAILADQQT